MDHRRTRWLAWGVRRRFEMKAMVIREFGGFEVFEKREVEDPSPGYGEIVVELRASAVNPVDMKLRERGSWAGISPPAILGSDAAGIVRSVGPGVDDFSSGDEVFYTAELNGRGTYAELHAVSASMVARKPEGVSFEEAASIPLVGCTSWDALIERTKILPGERVLIHGAGGVGSVAVQIAKAAGAWVAVTCGDYDFDMLRQLGADLVIDYRNDNFADLLKDIRVDVVFNTVGGDLLRKSLPVARRFGRMAIIASSSDDLDMAYRNNITVHHVMMTRSGATMEKLKNLIEWGRLRAVVDSIMDLSDVADAHRKLANGKVKGKIVLSP